MIPRRGRARILAPRRTLADRTQDSSAALAQLETIIRDVVSGKQMTSSFEELYRLAYRIVLKKQGDQLYQSLENVVYDTISTRLQALGNQEFITYAAASSTNVTFDEEREGVELKLFELKQAWADYEISGTMMSDILMYLDRVYAADTGKLPTMDLMSLIFAKAFRSIRYKDGDETTAAQQVLIRFFSGQLDRHRSGEIVDLSLLEKVATCLRDASQHAKSGESPFQTLEDGVLDGTRSFYRIEAESWRKHASEEVYLSQAPRRVQEETERCTAVFGTEAAKRFAQAAKDEFENQRPTET